jgi:hypothetical protein
MLDEFLKQGKITNRSKGLLRLRYRILGEIENEKPLTLLLSLLGDFISLFLSLFSPFSIWLLPKKRREGKLLDYLRFLMIQKPATTATATITAATIASSVVINGTSVLSVTSGSIGVAGVGA